MGGRFPAGIVLSGLVAGALVGCSAGEDPLVPEPAPASSPGCGVADTDVTWKPMTEGPMADLGYLVLTVEEDGSRQESEHHIPYASTVEYPGGLAYDDDAVAFLIEDFSRTGQTPVEDIGSSPDTFDWFSISDPAPDTYVLGYRMGQFAATFELDCDGEPVGSGQLHSTATTDLHGVFVACSESVADSTDEYERSLFTHCPG